MASIITAISTALSNGGIAVVRMSGEGCAQIASRLFRTKNSLQVTAFEPRKLYLGEYSDGKICERCLCVRFAAPYSFTGEEVVEFQIHGGAKLATAVLDGCIAAGARLAQPGEFTQRAVLNGKMTLSQAEGTADLIEATTTAELNAAHTLIASKLSLEIEAITKKIIDVISGIEVAIDYPEEDLEVDTLEQTRQKLQQDILPPLNRLLQTRSAGELIKSGIRVALVGKPNVGKSSTLNAIVRQDRAIVTDIPGTTRDTVEESIEYRGVRFILTDTAGLRDSDDTVERLGIEKSRRAIEAADIVVFLTDDTFDTADREIEPLLIGKPVLRVRNKSDRGAVEPNAFTISAKDGDGIDRLLEEIYRQKIGRQLDGDGVVLTSARHYACLVGAKRHLDDALTCPALDLLPLDLRLAVSELGKIDGTTVSEDVTNSIFAKFCLGK